MGPSVQDVAKLLLQVLGILVLDRLHGLLGLVPRSAVRFEEEEGEKGPQASTVKILRTAPTYRRRH